MKPAQLLTTLTVLIISMLNYTERRLQAAFQGPAAGLEQGLDTEGDTRVQEAMNLFQGAGVGDFGGGGEPQFSKT
jgi:hypothetical protein